MQFKRREVDDRNEDCNDNRGSVRVYGNRQEHHEKPCGMGKAAGLKNRAKGTYQKRYFGKVHGSERGKEPAG